MKRNLVYLIILAISTTQEIYTQDVGKVATKFRKNVVKINAVFANGRDENGFGTVIAERNNKLYIVTAKHVIQDDYRSKTTAVRVTFFSEQDKTYPGILLNLPANSSDISLIEVEKPGKYSWRNKFYSNAIKKETEVLFVGRSGQWYIPTIPGLINNISPDEIVIDINAIQPGTSGAPLISSDGMVGLIFQDDEGVSRGYSTKKLIEVITKAWSYPWQIKLNEQMHEIHGGIAFETIPRLGKSFLNFSKDKISGIGAFSAGYRYQLKKRIALGATIAFESFNVIPRNSTDKYELDGLYIMPDGRFYHINNKRLKLYSGLNAGLAIVRVKETGVSTETSIAFAYHVNVIGVRLGRKLGAFYELGIGYRGIGNIGASLLF